VLLNKEADRSLPQLPLGTQVGRLCFNIFQINFILNFEIKWYMLKVHGF